ncbi:MAG: ComEA family DNA-binding protein [Gammaproteobacteria bacterium]
MKMIKAIVVSLFLSFLSAAAVAEPVDINTADAKTLAAKLNGVGPKSAEAIVAYRTKHGPFKRVEDLDKVKGIGKKTIEKNRANMTAGGVK